MRYGGVRVQHVRPRAFRSRHLVHQDGRGAARFEQPARNHFTHRRQHGDDHDQLGRARHAERTEMGSSTLTMKTTNPRKVSDWRKSIAGFSVVELMVAVTLALIILVAVSAIFVNSKRSYHTQDR